MQDKIDASDIDTAKIPLNGGAAHNGSAGKRDKGELSMFCTACGTRNTTDANFCKQCGKRLERSGPLKISEEAFAQAGSVEEIVRAHLVSAYNKYETGDIPGAIESCNKAIEVQPDSTDAISLLSTLYEKQGERDKAIAAREKVLQLNPGSIADREKLEELRDGTLVIIPRKITSSRIQSSQSILDTRAGAAIVAITVTLLVMVAGLAAVLYGRSRQPVVQAQSPNNNQIAAVPNQFTSGNGFQQQGSPGAAQSAPNTFNNTPHTNLPQSSPVNSPGAFNRPPVRNQDNEDTSGRQIPPAPVLPPSNGNGNEIRTNPNANQGSGTVHLPDNGLAPSETGPPPVTNQSTPAVTPRRDTGRIEIIVSNDPQGTSKTTNNTVPRKGDGSSATMDSRSSKQIAQDYQLKSQYKLAVSNYIKALDGAGDDAASIHYQIGLCYQRLEERENAVAQYTAAVAAYKEQVAAGKNVDSATRGIKASEAGIKACQ
jgi:tetratricopeptide (TPR) repeat protein